MCTCVCQWQSWHCPLSVEYRYIINIRTPRLLFNSFTINLPWNTVSFIHWLIWCPPSYPLATCEAGAPPHLVAPVLKTPAQEQLQVKTNTADSLEKETEYPHDSNIFIDAFICSLVSSPRYWLPQSGIYYIYICIYIYSIYKIYFSPIYMCIYIYTHINIYAAVGARPGTPQFLGHNFEKPRGCPQRFVIEAQDDLVGGWATPLKDISQMGWFFPIYGKIKNVPNHQSAKMIQ